MLHNRCVLVAVHFGLSPRLLFPDCLLLPVLISEFSFPFLSFWFDLCWFFLSSFFSYLPPSLLHIVFLPLVCSFRYYLFIPSSFIFLHPTCRSLLLIGSPIPSRCPSPSWRYLSPCPTILFKLLTIRLWLKLKPSPIDRPRGDAESRRITQHGFGFVTTSGFLSLDVFFGYPTHVFGDVFLA